jgi:cold shock CspA family protein
MQGTMLWFNVDKGFGFIRTESEERLYVGRSDFQSGHTPEPRCRGREVSFDRHTAEGDVRAVNVFFTSQAQPRRARLRHARGGHSL